MNIATFHPLNNITKHSGLIRDEKKRKVYSIKFIRLHATQQDLVLLDSNYSQLLGFRNRAELLTENGLDRLAGYELYHCPFENKVFRIETDRLRVVGDVQLLPLNFSGLM